MTIIENNSTPITQLRTSTVSGSQPSFVNASLTGSATAAPNALPPASAPRTVAPAQQAFKQEAALNAEVASPGLAETLKNRIKPGSTSGEGTVNGENRINSSQDLEGAREESGTIDLSATEMEEVLGQMNEFFQSIQRNLRFVMLEESNEMVIQVFDADNEEMIRQVPPEELLAIAAHLEELRGLLFKGKA